MSAAHTTATKMTYATNSKDAFHAVTCDRYEYCQSCHCSVSNTKRLSNICLSLSPCLGHMQELARKTAFSHKISKQLETDTMSIGQCQSGPRASCREQRTCSDAITEVVAMTASAYDETSRIRAPRIEAPFPARRTQPTTTVPMNIPAPAIAYRLLSVEFNQQLSQKAVCR